MRGGICPWKYGKTAEHVRAIFLDNRRDIGASPILIVQQTERDQTHKGKVKREASCTRQNGA